MDHKEGMRTIDWVMAICSIMVLLLFIILPPVFRVIFVEETPPKMEQANTLTNPTFDDSMYSKVSCLKQETLEDSIKIRNIVFAVRDNALKMWTDATTYTYWLDSKENENLFAQASLKCDNQNLYQNILGFYYDCYTSENTIRITKKYDLSKFQTTTINDQGQDIVLSSEYAFDQDVEAIKTSLSRVGYTCQ